MEDTRRKTATEVNKATRHRWKDGDVVRAVYGPEQYRMSHVTGHTHTLERVGRGPRLSKAEKKAAKRKRQRARDRPSPVAECIIDRVQEDEQQPERSHP